MEIGEGQKYNVLMSQKILYFAKGLEAGKLNMKLLFLTVFFCFLFYIVPTYGNGILAVEISSTLKQKRKSSISYHWYSPLLESYLRKFVVYWFPEWNFLSKK